MNRLLIALLAVVIGLVVLCALLTALASAGASLANGVANAAAATALMTSQCAAAIMIVMALLAGGVLGIGAAAARNALPTRRDRQLSHPRPRRLAAPAWQELALLSPGDDEDDELTQALAELLKDVRT